MPWTRLPPEILQQVIGYLGQSLAQFRLTCRPWYQQSYGFAYHHFKVTSNVFEFADTLTQSPYRPGVFVKSITFTDDFVAFDSDIELREVVDTIFCACPNIESIQYSLLARNLIWHCIIDSAKKSRCLKKVIYVGEGSNMLTKYLRTEEESDPLYVQVMYALKESITLLKLFNDGCQSLLPEFRDFRKRLHCFKALTTLRLHGCFTIEELDTILDSCQTVQILIIFSDNAESSIFGPMPPAPIVPHLRLKHLQVQNGLAPHRTDIQFILQKFQHLDSCVIEKIDMQNQRDAALNLAIEQLIHYGMQVEEFKVHLCNIICPLDKLRTCLCSAQPLISVFVDVCFLDSNMTNAYIYKHNDRVSIYIVWDERVASLDELSSLSHLCKSESVQASIHGRMKDTAKLTYLNSIIQTNIALSR